jgi:hypothetical protein
MVLRIPSKRPPPKPFVPKIPDRDPDAVQKTVWFPQRRMALVGYREDRHNGYGRPTMEPVFDVQWFWSGARVWVMNYRMADNGGIGNLFAPILLFNILTQPTKIVTVYERITDE